MTIIVQTRALGVRRPLMDDFSVEPPTIAEGDDGFTLRDLITAVVREQVELFNQRRLSGRFDRVLTSSQIKEQTKKGKVDPAGKSLGEDADPEQAVATALLAFEDGLYLVTIDGIERRNLEEVLYLSQNSRVTFIRLAFLAGA